MYGNLYYEVVEPIFYLDRVGYSPSNSWIGRSQVLESVFVGRNAVPGDEFHLLVGGDFLLHEDGSLSDVAFWIPKPIFEKSYGGSNTSRDLFVRLKKSGAVRRIAEPGYRIDYAAARRETKFPMTHPQLTREESSVTFQSLRDQAGYLADMAKDFGLQANFYDFGEERRALFQIVKKEPEGRRMVVEFKVMEGGRLYVVPSEHYIDIPSFMEMAKALPEIDTARTYDTSFWMHGTALFNDEGFLNEMESRLDGAANGFKATSPAGP